MVVVLDGGQSLRFGLDDLLRYHGPRSPGGVAHAFKVLERTLPLLAGGDPPDRRAITIRTAFGGPGARDGFELVTRAVSDDRYVVDASLALADRGRASERFVFALSYGDTTATVAVRPGIVTDEFVDLARTEPRTPAQEARLTALKRAMADRLAALSADDVYELVELVSTRTSTGSMPASRCDDRP
jgi:hypothetical protein